MNLQTKVLVTGATGFVGRALLFELRKRSSHSLVSASRSAHPVIEGIFHRRHDLLDSTQLPELNDIQVVVHTAARVHVMNDQSADKLAAYRAANVDGTLALANAAAAAGVRRFIYLSSIKVNGEETSQGKPFTAFDQPCPQDPYGISKMEAEIGLRQIEALTKMEVVVIRPPLVYGPGVKANFRGMMKWLERGVPLPFGAVNNRRSLVGRENLIDLIALCIVHHKAGGQDFLVSDGEDISTTQLLKKMRSALDCRTFLLPIPPAVLNAAATMLGKGDIARRVMGWLQVDIAHTQETLGWAPPLSLEAGLELTAAAYKAGLRSQPT